MTHDQKCDIYKEIKHLLKTCFECKKVFCYDCFIVSGMYNNKIITNYCKDCKDK
jgi:hypothetical protein